MGRGRRSRRKRRRRKREGEEDEEQAEEEGVHSSHSTSVECLFSVSPLPASRTRSRRRQWCCPGCP